MKCALGVASERLRRRKLVGIESLWTRAVCLQTVGRKGAKQGHHHYFGLGFAVFASLSADASVGTVSKTLLQCHVFAAPLIIHGRGFSPSATSRLSYRADQNKETVNKPTNGPDYNDFGSALCFTMHRTLPRYLSSLWDRTTQFFRSTEAHPSLSHFKAQGHHILGQRNIGKQA